jgi:hypothetical protein
MSPATAPLLATSVSTEVVGYVASALVVLSLTMASVVRLRAISLVGSITFFTYGLLIGSVPIVLTNLAIAAINIWFLRTELGGHRDLGASLIDIDTPFLEDFVQFHLNDIHRFQPGFTLPEKHDPVTATNEDTTTVTSNTAVLLTRDGLPAGAVIGSVQGRVFEVHLDYVMRQYRDSRLGEWLYGPTSPLPRMLAIDAVRTRPGLDTHRPYLERVGFRQVGDCYESRFGTT